MEICLTSLKNVIDGQAKWESLGIPEEDISFCKEHINSYLRSIPEEFWTEDFKWGTFESSLDDALLDHVSYLLKSRQYKLVD